MTGGEGIGNAGRRQRFAIIVPILNAEKDAPAFLAGLQQQSLAPDVFLVIDSSSDDRSAEIFAKAGARVHVIPRSEFNHADTRQMAADMVVGMDGNVEVAVFLTQDAILANADSLELLVSAFAVPDIGTAYGRQLPRHGADALESYVRLFNYPDRSEVRSFEDRKKYGFRTCFSSNSYAAYRIRALKGAGGFPGGLITGEDLGVTANILLDGWKLAYVADACVFHSHRYTASEYFRRSFDIGVQHTQSSDKIMQFGGPEGMGVRYVLAEMIFLLRHAPLRIPEALGRNLLRYVGYRLGRIYQSLPRFLVLKLTMQHGFWADRARKSAGA
jgi:rhamnosyltransferase